MIHWQVPFDSYLGDAYVVNVYDDTYSGDPVILTGGASPFTTSEENGKDIFIPVRYQTGYLNVIDEGNLDGLFPPTPEARPVTLTKNNVIMWQGFLRQDAYSQKWAARPFERSFPVVSSLGMLEGIQLQKGDLPNIARFAQILSIIINRTKSTFDTIVMPFDFAEQSGGTGDALLRLGIQDRNWFTYKNENLADKTDSRYEGVTWLEMLEAWMGAFGYTMYEQGTTLYITGFHVEYYVSIPVSSLPTYAENGHGSPTAVTRPSINIASLPVSSARGKQNIALAFRKAVVESEINKYSDDSMPVVDSKYLDFAGLMPIRHPYLNTPTSYYYDNPLAGLYMPIPDHGDPIDITDTVTSFSRYLNNAYVWTSNSYSKTRLIPVTPGDTVKICRDNTGTLSDTAGVWAWMKVNTSTAGHDATNDFAEGHVGQKPLAKGAETTEIVPSDAHYLLIRLKTASNGAIGMKAYKIPTIESPSVWTFKAYEDGAATVYDAQNITRDYYQAAFVRETSGDDVLLVNWCNLSGGSGFSTNHEWVVSLKSATETYFAGYLQISGKVDVDEGEGGTLHHHAYFAMRIGDKYYDPDNETWTSTYTYFAADITEDGKLGGLNSYNTGEDGFLVKLPEGGIFGDIEVFFYRPVTTASGTFTHQVEGMYVFRDFKVEAVYPPEDIYHDYPVHDNNYFAQQLNIYGKTDTTKNLRLSSFIRERMGYGVLISPDFQSPLGQLYWEVERKLMYFEECLLEALADAGERPIEYLSIPLRSSSTYTPITQVSSYRYLSSARNWREDTQDLQIYKNMTS